MYKINGYFVKHDVQVFASEKEYIAFEIARQQKQLRYKEIQVLKKNAAARWEKAAEGKEDFLMLHVEAKTQKGWSYNFSLNPKKLVTRTPTFFLHNPKTMYTIPADLTGDEARRRLFRAESINIFIQDNIALAALYAEAGLYYNGILAKNNDGESSRYKRLEFTDSALGALEMLEDGLKYKVRSLVGTTKPDQSLGIVHDVEQATTGIFSRLRNKQNKLIAQ